MKPGIERHALSVLNNIPWLFEIAMYHQYQEDSTSMCNGKPTMCTDGRTVYYHPNVLRWPHSKIEGVLIHEWLHGAHHHVDRLHRIPDADAELWNIACDAVINPICESFGYPLTDGINIPWADGMTAYEVYVRLKQSGSKPKQKPSDYRPGNMRKPKGPGDPSNQGAPGVDDPNAVNQEDMPMLARLLASAKAAGKLPAGFKSIVDKWLEPKVDWRAVLREYCTKTSRDGWSYERANSSYRAMGLHVPGRRSRSLGDVVIVRDTSMSLHKRQQEVASEACSIFLDNRPERMVLIDCDAGVHQVIELRPGDSFPTNAMGGGGTDFRPAFEAVEKNGYNPQVMVFITDLDGKFPKTPPSYPVIWAIIGSSIKPPFGNTVLVNAK